MRKAAGILMILYGVKTTGLYASYLFLDEGGFNGYYLDPFVLVSIIAAVFFITGGGFCLKRKYWKLCFALSLCLSVFVFFDAAPTFHLLEFLNMPYLGVGPLLLACGILPIVLVCVGKSEWSESQAGLDFP
jgi:hypothetical protein